MIRGVTPATLAVGLALAWAGCGDDEGGAEAEAPATTEEAIAQIAEVRSGLDEAMATYAEGDAAAAADTVSETYLQHFEIVEGPLEEVDEELNEDLENRIREELVGEIEAGASDAQVTKLVAGIQADLDQAEKALEGAGS